MAAVAEQPDRLADHVAQLLGTRTIGTAESCTGGQVVTVLAGVPSASDVVRGGLVAYQDRVKRDLLNVAAPSVLSEQAAVEMARGVATLLGADVTVATTGVAGEEPVDGVEPGTVFVATAVGDALRVNTYRWDPTVGDVREYATLQALADVRAHLLDAPTG